MEDRARFKIAERTRPTRRTGECVGDRHIIFEYRTNGSRVARIIETFERNDSREMRSVRGLLFWRQTRISVLYFSPQ